MKTRRIPLAIAVAAALLTPNSAALAAALGEVATLSALGERFRAEIRLVGSGGIQASCFRVVAPGDPGAGIPALTSGRVSIVGQGANARLVVRDDRAVNDPVLQLAIENVCEARLRRDYTLLMPFTAASPVSAPVSAAPARTPAATRNPPAAPRGTSSSPARSSPQKAAARTWSTAPGESLESLGEALYPDDRSARERFRAATAAANPGLFPDPGAYDKALPAGTRVVIPNMRQVANAAPAKTRTPTATRAMRAVAVQTEQKTEDRVIVDKADAPPPRTRAATSASPHAIRPEAGDRSADLLGRERDLAAAIDRSIIAEMELLARIKELEDVQTQLEARIRAIAATATTAATAPPATALPRLAASTTATPALEPAETKDNSQDLYLFAGMGIAALLLALALLRKRSTTTSSKTPLLEHRAQHLRVVDTPSDTKVLRRGHASSEDTSFAGGFGMPASQQAPEQARVLPRKAASGGVEEPAIEEHKSAVELAEIMMSFGRVQGAAETLAEFVRSNPREAVAPWLKLLEVYRAAGLRAEFETIAGELNKTFNVITVGWSNYESLRDARASLEDLPHISETIQKSWGTSVCQRYLQHLLHDNRDGTRQGFPISTVDEILTLSAILEDQLGPYRSAVERSMMAAEPQTGLSRSMNSASRPSASTR